MEPVPQIVRERLKARQTVVDHPDADLLTAFSERSLTYAERNLVAEHLARCAECREVVALALPPSEFIQDSLRIQTGRWFAWPTLRWGLVAAGFAVVSSFGIVAYRHQHSATATMAYKALSQPFSSMGSNQPSATPIQQPTEQPSFVHEPDRTSSNPATSHPAARNRSSGITSGTSQHVPRVQWQQSANNLQYQASTSTAVAPARQLAIGQISGNVPASSQSQTVEVSAQSPTLDSTLQAQNAEPNSQPGYTISRVERSKPAAESAAQSAAPVALVVWNITPTGDLQRSFDQGTTWQDVDVNRPGAVAAELADTTRMSRAKEAPDTSQNDTLQKKHSSALIFRAVTSNGPDVWAGATGGLLYHSIDAGAHWIRVVPSASGASLTGDIVSLTFLDPQHGRIVTSAPEVWTTFDAGQSWQKQ